MTAYAGVTVRSLLAAGVAATAVGALALTPVTPAAPVSVRIASPAVQLSAAVANVVTDPLVTDPLVTDPLVTEPVVTGAGDPIIAVYEAVQPWIAWGWELVDWGMSWVPGLWWIAPGVDMAYWTIQPLAEAAVYSFAYLLNGQTDLIGPTIQQGIQNAANNFVQGAVNWVYSIVPLPPLPPFPIFPTASVNPAAATARTAPVRPGAAAAQAAPATPEAAAVAETAAIETVTDVPTPKTATARTARQSGRAAAKRPVPAASLPAASAAATPADSTPTAPVASPARAVKGSDHPAQHQGGRQRAQK